MKELIKSLAVWFIMLGISWSKNIPYDVELKVHEVFSTVQFVENKGIYNNEVLYFSTSRNVFILKDGTIIANGIELKFGEPKEIKLDMLTPTGFSYFSNDKALDLETYARVVLKSAYKNIDVMLTSLGKNQLEFQFIVKPRANVNDIKLIINNAESIEEGKDFIRLKKTCTYEKPRILNEDEEKYPKERDCSIYIKKPEAYQGSEEVKVHYEIRNNVLSYKVEKYDKNKTLIIDPTAILTGSSTDLISAIAVDNQGNIFITGGTNNYLDFSENRIIYGSVGSGDAFVVKLVGDLTSVVRTAILAGIYNDWASTVAIDNNGNVFVGGRTWDSSDFSMNRVVYGTPGWYDAFVVKLTNNLDSVIRTAIITSDSGESVYSIAIDKNGDVLVGGATQRSLYFSVNRVFHGVADGHDAFIVRLTNNLDSVIKTAIIGSSAYDQIGALAIDNNGNVFASGFTRNYSNFSENRVIYGTPGGNIDAFVVKLTNDLSSVIRTAILASSGYDYAHELAVDNIGNLFVGGETTFSLNFSVNRVFYGNIGVYDAFVVKMTNNLDSVFRTAILASDDYDYTIGLHVVGQNPYVLIAGITYDANSFGGNNVMRFFCGSGGNQDVFIARLRGDLDSLQKVVIATGDGFDEGYWCTHCFGIYGSQVYVGSFEESGVYTLSTYPDLAVGKQYTYGTAGDMDIMVIYPRCTDIVGISENKSLQEEVIKINGEKLFIKLLKSSYIGFDVYELNGRIVYSKSLGFLPIGEYSYKLNLNRGSYIIKVRIGEEIRILKLVL
jgi:hypothetical protein